MSDPNLIYAGQDCRDPRGIVCVARVVHPAGLHAAQGASQSAAPPARRRASGAPVNQDQLRRSSGYSSSDLSVIPGVPQSLAACVAYRESTNLQNPAANGNAYASFRPAGYNVDGTSLANQKQVFAKLYQQYGGSPWACGRVPGNLAHSAGLPSPGRPGRSRPLRPPHGAIARAFPVDLRMTTWRRGLRSRRVDSSMPPPGSSPAHRRNLSAGSTARGRGAGVKICTDTKYCTSRQIFLSLCCA